MQDPREHLPEIDWLKGFAILGVIGIHAKLYAESFLFLQVINRSVHVFLFLFGISSELWWRRELEAARSREGQSDENSKAPARRWFLGRLRRILPGYWAMTVAWWLLVALWRKPPGDLELGWPQALISFTGWAPWIGTSWFVAIILQYVLLFPVLRRVTLALGGPVSLVLAAGASFASCWFILQIVTTGKSWFGNNVPWPGWYYQWIFAPRLLWDVVAGIFVARYWHGRVGAKATLIALGLTAVGAYLTLWVRGGPGDTFGPVREMAVAHLVDVPLAIGLLGAFRWAPVPEPARRLLSWCGRYSWGLYLGHLLLHEWTQIAGLNFFSREQWVRALYALGLLLGGMAIAVTASRVESRISTRVQA